MIANRWWQGLLSVVSVLGVGATMQATPLYQIKDITPAGYVSAVAYDINSAGDAVGVASVSGSEAYFFYDHSAGTSTVFGVGTVLPRGTISGTGFREAAINDSGLIAGTARFVGPVTQSRGFIYNGTTFSNLGTLAGATGTGLRPASDALDINGTGFATGTATSGVSTIGGGGDNIDIYIGASAPISDIDGDTTVVTRGDRGRAINDAGKIVGSNELGKAAIFAGAGEFSILASTSLAADGSSALDINESDEVVGHTIGGDSFFYDPAATTSVTILPKLGGGRIFAKGVNEDGDIVGQGDIGFGNDDAAFGFIRTDGVNYVLRDQVVDLSQTAIPGLGDWGRLSTAWAINDSGMIVGEGGRRFTGNAFPTTRAYLLIPVPEPASALLIAFALLVAARRR